MIDDLEVFNADAVPNVSVKTHGDLNKVESFGSDRFLVDEWTDKQRDVMTNEQMDRYTNGLKDRQTDRKMNKAM